MIQKSLNHRTCTWWQNLWSKAQVYSCCNSHSITIGSDHGDMSCPMIFWSVEICSVMFGVIEGLIVINTVMLVISPSRTCDVFDKVAVKVQTIVLWWSLKWTLLPYKICYFIIKRVSKITSGRICPLETLCDPVIKQSIWGHDCWVLISVDNIEDGREDSSTGWRRNTVQIDGAGAGWSETNRDGCHPFGFVTR